MTATALLPFLQERNGGSKLTLLKHPVFWIVLGIKVLALIFLSSSVLTEQYLPFVNYFIESGFSDPYTHFYGSGVSFPFPALMLLLLAIPKILFGFLSSFEIAVIRLPLILADVTILLILSRWLRNQQGKLLLYYWCSPILFAICYVAGFLDIVPIALLFVFLYFLFKDKYALACIFLGFALAAKSGLVVLLPFIVIYLLKEHMHPLRILGYMLFSCGMYILINLEYLFNPGLRQVIMSGGQDYVSSINLAFAGTVVYVPLLVYLALLVAIMSFKRLHRDMFLMFMAFVLGIITLVTMPQAGWYAWIVPFFVYFFVKEGRIQKYPFIFLNIAYFAFFLLAPNALYLNALGIPSISVGTMPTNVAFTLLQGTLLLNVIWIYRIGIQNSTRLKILYRPYLIGIAGDSASGKSTLTRLITMIFGEHNTLEVAGDDMHKWERGDRNWAHFTHLNPLANHLHNDMEHARLLKNNENVARRFYDHTIGRFTQPERVRPKKVIVFQGLHAFYLKHTRQLLDLKIFLAPNEELRRQWKVERDTLERGHAPEHVLKQLDERASDAERFISEQKKYADVVISIEKIGEQKILEITCDNSLYVDPLVSLFKEQPLLEVSHEHNGDHQRLTFRGQITAETIDSLGYTLVPEVSEINRTEICWEDDYNGILQLFLTYIIFYKARMDHESF